MKKRTLFQIAGFIVSLIGLIIATLNFSEDQIASILSISKMELSDAPLLLNKLSNCFRFSLIPLFVSIYIIIVVVYNYFNKKSNIIFKTNIDNNKNQIKRVLDYIEREPNIQSLKVWGYSLNWVSDISAFLHENPRHGLNVKLFIPNLNQIESLFEDDYITERKTVLNLRLKEWKKLKHDNYINSLDIYYQNTIPNDLGIIIDEKIGFFGSYNWDLQINGKVKHRRIETTKRLRYELNTNELSSKFLCDYQNQRFICREKDSKHENL
jgi:hypothetical protein